jgi:hypothetical protein
MKNQRDRLHLTASSSMPGPGAFLLGSVESRAAARAHVQQSLERRRETTYLLIWILDREGNEGARIDPWFEHKDGTLTRNVLVTSEMSEEETLEIFGTRENPVRGQRIGLYGVHR